MFIITQGYGIPVLTASTAGIIPEYSSTGDTYSITVDLLATPQIAVQFEQEITGLDKTTPQQ